MKKFKLLLCCTFMLLCSFFQANAQGNCPWNVTMNVVEATCLNNGGIEFFLLTDNGDTIAIDIENKKPVDPSINLSEIKFYHQSLTNVEDTTTYYTPNPRIFLKPGTYRVGVQAQCYNGGEGSGAYTPLSYEQIIEVVGSYTVPTVAILANTATNSQSSGNRPTVPCGNTGRIQLKITDGSMPYSLVLVNSITKDTVRTKYITRAEGHSTDTLSADFKDLYTFDTLPAGSYRLYFSDACDFKDSAITWTVENIKFPQLTSIHIDPVNYNYSSGYYNIFRFSSTYLSPGDVTDYLYDYYAQNMQYRVCYGTKDTSDWKPFPIWNANIQNDNRYYIGYDILDTAHHISKYCEIEGEYLTFQYRTTSCTGGDTVNLYSYRIQPYLSMYTTTNEDIDFQSVYYDSCTYHIPGVHKHTLNIKSDWYYNSWSLQTNAPSSDESWNNMYHRYVTMPITYTLKDTVTGQVIKTQTVNNINRWTVDISDIEAVYGDITGDMQLPLKLERTDSKGCVVSNNNEIHVYDQNQTIDGNHWLSYNHDYYGYTCCSRLSNFNIFETFNANREQAQPIPQRYKQMRDGAKFQITKSPRRNKYNMTATYHYDTDSWTVEKESEFNNAEITYYENEGYDAENNNSHYYWGVRVEDYCIPYGQYNFRLITDCDTQTYNGAWLSNDYERRIKYEKPAYTTTQECDNYYITLEAGQCKYNLIGSTSDEFQDELIVGEGTMSTFFKIISGPANGYPTNDFQRGETIRLTIPGTYTLRMYSPDNYCESAYFDTTITYTGGTVSFDYAYAYVCDADSTVGFFYCQAKDGMAPYHYSLYELTNMEGNLLEENNTGSFKGLSNIHVGDMMSLEVGDACGRSYYVNITVTDLSSSRLAWFDGALRVTETCEGSEIDVYISAVEEDFTYHWTGPNGFDVTTPRGHIVIGRGSEPGDYTVEIGNTGCSQTLKDTVTLGIIPAPKVEMSYGANAVCPGQNVTLSFTPTQGTGNITYIIGREINSIDTFYNFSGVVGETASLEYTATSEATFWIHKVEDEICNYTIPEDTVKITLRDAATACDVSVTDLQVCYGAQAVLTASSSTMVKPYTIKWYDNPYQQNVLKTDVIEDGMPDASFTTGRLYADSALYVTIQDATHCETYTGTVNQWMNMADGNTGMTCGQSIRLFDDGGSNGNYQASKYYKHTFTSTDGNLITLSFNSFNTQLNGDVMRVYTGDEVLQDSLLALISGSNLPESLTSNGTSMTIVFVSNSAIEAKGWDALISCSAMPAKANIKVLEDLSVTLSISPELPARYGQNYTLTAVANGGQGSRYEFTWHIADAQLNEQTLPPHELAFNTDIYNLDNLTETRYVWVVVKDKSDNPCTVEDKMSNLIQIEIADIALNLELSSTVSEICQGDIPMIVKIKNEGSQTANNVKVKLALPDGMSLIDEADSLILFPEINAQGTVYDTLFIRNEAHVSTSTSMDIRAQIWSCDQGDNNSNWHNWDWTGNPNEADESIYTFTIRPSLDIVNAPGLTVSSANICFGGDATIQAHSNLDYPQHFIWYADAALTQVIKDTTLENNTSIIVSNEFTNITQEGALCYVMVENSNYCPAYTTVDYRTKMQFAPTDTILMHNGSSMVGNADHIRFFDDGGADNNYAPNKRYGYLFTSVDGSPLAIYFDENNYISNYNNNARIEIYDGESEMTPRIARYTNSQMRDKVLVATTGKMFIKFYSDDYTDQGISAHVFTTSRAMVAEADVTFKTPMAASEITTTDDQVCYGENATLTASALNLAFPQTHYWYDENLNPVDTITVEAADAHSTLPISSVTSASNYYVTVSNADECPVPVGNNQMVIEPLTNNDLQLNTSTNGRATNITNQDVYAFYDEGGANNDYFTHDANWTHTFTATDGGEITLFIKSFESESCCDYMRIYDGASTSGAHMTELRGANSNLTYTSTTGSITIFWHTDGSVVKSGWDALVYTTTSLMAKATASIKLVDPNDINTNDVTVCYGDSATLTASANLSYPQYYTWYAADRITEWKDTIYSGSSELKVLPTSEEPYYVTVSCDTTCPIVDNVPTNREELLMSYGGYYNITTDKVFDIYDDGGRDGNYSRTCTTEVYGFSAPSNSYIHIHFNNVDLGDNPESYIYLNYNDASTGEYKNIRINGRESNWDHVAHTNYINMDVTTGCEDNTHPGWDGYIYISSPKDPADLAKVNVSFAEPSFSQNVTTSDVEACYGDEITLTASNIGSTSRYAWYDENYNLIKDTIGQYGTLDITAIGNATYYVNASATNECPVMPPHYGEFWFDASQNGEITNLTEGVAIPFYDAGGPDANYNTPEANWTHTFIAPAGKQVTLHLDLLETTAGHTLYVYDGTTANGNYINHEGYCEGNCGNDFTSNSGALTVRWEIRYNEYSFGSRRGWAGQIGVLDANNDMQVAAPDLAAANVSIKAPIAASEITTTDAQVCYGETATLTASANIDFPQTHTWYDENMNMLNSFTVYDTEPYSSITIDNVSGTATRLVSVSNVTECPVIIPAANGITEREILLNENNHGKRTYVTPTERIAFYDAGGANGSFTANSYTHTFTAIQGTLKAVFDQYIGMYYEDTLYAYNGEDDTAPLLGKWGGYDYTYSTISSTGPSITFKLVGHEQCCWNGWSVKINSEVNEDVMAQATAHMRIGAPESITAQDVVICYGDDAILEASSDIAYDQTFTWYGPDRTTVLDVQPISSGSSTYTVSQPTEEGTYYVMVTNDTTCQPYSPVPNYIDVLMDGNQTSHNLSSGTAIRFYDAGGINGDYESCNYKGNTYTYYFRASQGARIHFHLNSIELDNYGNAYMYVYNNNWNQIDYITGYHTDLDYEVETQLIVQFYNCSGETHPGWDGIISLVEENTTPVDPANLKAINVSFMDPVITDNIQVDDQEACYGETVTLSVNNYDPNMQYVWFDENYEVIGRSETIDVTVTENRTYYVNASASNECPIITPDFDGVLTAVQVNLKAPVAPSHITTNSPIEICYGSDAVMTANADIDYPQTVTWYDADRTIPLRQQTISSGKDTLTVHPTESGNYYVYVTNGANCPLPEGIVPVSVDNLAAINVSFSEPVFTQIAVTEDVEACYGEPTTLTASVPGNTELLHYAWFDENYNYLYDSIGVNGQVVITTTENTTYYVNVSAANECPVLPPHYREINFTENINHRTTNLTTVGRGILFYDEGGSNSNYYTSDATWYHTFTAPEGQHVTLKLNSLDLGCCGEYLYVYEGTYSNIQYEKIRYGCGYPHDDPITSDGNSLTVHWYNKSSCFNAGWEAVVGILDANNEMQVVTPNLTATHVTIKPPVDPAEIVTVDGEGCFEATATLQASSNQTVYPQIFYWYDDDLNFVGVDTADNANDPAQYIVTNVSGTATYYVTMGNGVVCPVVVENNQIVGNNMTGTANNTIILNDNTNNGSTTVGEQDVYAFYDEGGPDNYYYSTYVDWVHTFTADNNGQIQLYFSEFNSEDCCDYLQVYDGTSTNGTMLVELRDYHSDLVYKSTTGSLTVRWRTDSGGEREGWKAIVSNAQIPMASATVNLKAPLGSSEIITTNAGACYGGSVTLTAQTSLSYISFPQTHTWYDEDMNELGSIPVDETEGHSSWTVDPVTETSLYYVSISNATECPVMMVNAGEVRLNDNTNGLTTAISMEHPVHFYDEGGKYDSYSSGNGGTLTHSFTAPSGEQVYAEFTDIRMNYGDIMYVYDGTSENDDLLYTINSDNNNGQSLSLQSNHGALTFKLERNGNCCDWGWNAMIATSPMQPEVRMSNSQTTNSTILSAGQTIDFYDAGGPNNSFCINGNSSFSHTFTTISGKLQIAFKDYINLSNAHLYVYDGTETNSGNLIAEYSSYNNFNENNYPVFTTTSSSLTIKIQMDYSWSTCLDGWRAEVTAIPDLAEAKAFVRVGNPESITANDVEICYGSAVTLEASSNIGYDQTFTWYAPNRATVLDQQTISSGNSTLTVQPTEETTYYVMVTDDTTCQGTTYSYTDVLMNGNQREYYLSPGQIINFYDAGGINGNYEDCRSYDYNFYAPQGSKVFFHLNNIELDEDGNAYMNIEDAGENNWHQLAQLRGSHTNMDYVTESNRLYIYFYNCSNPTFAGWDGTISIYNPQEPENMNAINVTFTTPVITDNIQVEDKEVCYGDTARLTASKGNDIKLFAWFDEEYNLLKTEEAVISTLDVEVTGSATYYVNASATNECPVVQPDFDGELTAVHVSLKAPVSPSNIITESPVEICYGSERTLTATSSISAPQHFTWYDSDRRTILGEEDVTHVGGTSSITVRPGEETTYYVAVTNSENCPIIESVHNNHREVLMNGNGNNSYNLAPHDIIDFYDAGGINGDYNSGNSYEYYFETNGESKIRFHLNSIELYENENVYMDVYDSESGEQIAHITGSHTDMDYVVDSRRIRVYFRNESNQTAAGWDGYIYALNQINTDDLAAVDVTFSTPVISQNIETTNGEACYGTAATLTATVPGNNTLMRYAWFDEDYNLLKDTIGVNSDLQVIALGDDTYYVNVSGTNECPVIPPHYGQVDLVSAQVSVKAPIVADITTTNGTACYGDAVTLTASADIAVPQYYTWYDEDQNFIASDTVFNVGDESELLINSVLGTRDYYVTVYNDTACPVILNKEVLMSNVNSTTIVTPQLLVDFYDAGGTDSYQSSSNTVTHTFTASSGQVYASLVGEVRMNYDDKLYIYDGPANSTNLLYVINRSSNSSTPTVFQSTQGSLTFKHEQHGSCCEQGWHIIVATYPVNAGDDSQSGSGSGPRTIPLSYKGEKSTQMTAGETLTFTDDNYHNGCFYAYYKEDYKHTFTAAEGNIQVIFNSCIGLCDGMTLYAYDGTDDSGDLLGSWSGSNCDYPSFTSQSSSITFYMRGYEDCYCYDGWTATVSNINAGSNTNTESGIAVATVSVKAVDPSSIVTTNDTICYGSEATLTASSEIAVPQYYFWYGPDRMSVLKYDTVTVEGGHSSFSVLTGVEETYYVSVTNDTTCPYMEPIHNNVIEVWLGSDRNSHTYNLSANDSILFYDAGGPNGNYDESWSGSATFEAPAGSHIRIHFNSIDFGNRDNARMTIYGHNANGNEYQVAYLRDMRAETDLDYLIESDWARVYFENWSSRTAAGWDGYVYAITPREESELAEARVRFKEPVGPGTITTENPFEVCYGSEVTLTASSTLDADQYFVWYAEDRVNILKRDTVHTAGQNSMLTVTPDEDHTTYYVAVTNAANCPIIENIHTHYREVLIGQSYQLQPYDSIGFFDDGGRNNNYAVNSSSRSSYITAEDGSHIRIHFDTISLARRAYLRIRDEENNLTIASISGPIDTANLDYMVEGNRVYFNFDNDKSSLTAMGWNAYIYAITPHNEDELVEVNVEFMDPQIVDQNEVTVTEVEACYGETVTLTASVESIEPQRFVWYDESSVLLKDEVRTGNSSLTVVATEEAFYYVNVSSPEECPALPPYESIDDYALPYGHVILKAGVPGTEITTTDDEVCFGGEAVLTATSSIAFPQYYTWFAPDRITILKQETVTAGGHSTFTVTADEETDYYVAISNDENCPIVDQIHNHYVEILMDGSRSSYELADNDSVGFFDAGGKTGDYLTGWSGDFNFRADEGSFIRIHFDTVQLARNAYIQIYEGDNYNSSVAYITGSRGNLDTIIENNRVRIYFYGYSNSSAPGWEAYVYALNPRDEDELASAHVNFMQPSINNNLITTTNAEGCYSATDTVKAVSTLTENQYFAWYDNEMNLLKQEVIPSGEYSELPVEILANTTYYVNVSTENECPVLPPHYGEFWFNASVNGGTTNLAEGEGVPFYDEAGPDGRYTTSTANWTHTFVAPAGKQVTVNLDYMRSDCGHRLEFYEGTTSDNAYQNQNYFRYFDCGWHSNQQVTSQGNILTIRWIIDYNEYSMGNYDGWDGLIGVVDDHGSMSTNSFDMAEATVTVTSPTWNLPLTTTNDTVCYGDAAYLTASSTIDYPQHYLWYAPDARTILLRDTVDGVIKTESEFNAPYYYHYQDQTYYVAIGNAENCPPVLVTENEPRTVLLNAAAHEQTTILGESDAVKFYDAGGLNDSYHDHNSDYTHTFQATHGTLMVQFKDDYTYIGHDDTLYVYDSDQADESRLLGKVINRYDEETDERVMDYDRVKYYSTGSYMTFRFKQADNGNWGETGWNATIMPYNLQNELATSEVNVKITSIPEMAVTTKSDTICYGSEAVVSASADLQYPQYYTWYNSQMEVLQQDTLFDASETESVLNLPAQYRNETYYAYIYSDTVSCIMDMEAMPKQYSELYLNTSMDGGTTVVHPYDSIGFFSDGTLQGSNNRSLDMDYYFTAESGLIQIHFDELELTYETYMEFIDDGYDIDFMEIGENTFYDITITSLSNTLHLDLDSKSSDRASARWSGTITNINVVNSKVLSKMAQANVAVEINNSVATVRTTNDTVCIGSPAMLTASSDIAFPQYYTWYNADLSSILFEDTIASGSSNFYIPGQVGNANYYVMASNDTTCILRPITIHNNFREYIFDANMSGHTIFVGAIDSVVIYDDGGKDGDYTIPEDERILIMKVETYPGATLNFRVPMAQLYQEDDDLELVIAEPDENGNIGEGSIGMMLMGSINDEVSYNTSGNVAFIAWIMYGTDLLPMPGFEMVVTADLHPEQHFAEAQVIMKNNLPMDYNALTNATSTVICQGDNAELEATSNLTENPQYFLWYSNDLSRVIGADTVYSGSVSHVSIPNLMQDTLLYVAVGTDEVCPAYPMEHKLISEIKLNTLTNAHTTYLSAVDSVLFYDDGGKNNRYTFQNGYLYRTFKASSGHVVFNLHELSITDCDDENFLGVLDGEFDIQNVDEDSIRAMYYAEEIPAGDSIIISTGNTLSIIFVSDHMHEDEPNNGWFASVYTTEQVNSDMSVLTPAEVTVNPTYQFDVYDTTNASHTPYTTPDNMFRDIDVTAEGEYVIDSVYQTALNCDSTYTLHLTVLPPTVQDIIIASNSNSWTYDGWYHREEVYTVVYGLDTLTADAGSDGKVFTMPGTGDVLTITPDATAEVIYFTPTPVPNSFSYVLDNETDYPSVTTDTGTLEITPIATEITITANSASKYYDGTPLTNDGFTYTPADILVEGDTLVAEIVGTITEIGDSLNRVVSYQVLRNVNFNRRGLASYTQDVTNCYTFALPVSGTLSIVDTFTVSCEVVNGGRICPGSNDGTATITIEGGKYVSPDRYEYSIVGDNTGYNNTGHTEGEIILNTLSPDNYTVTATDALGLTATATFSIVERPVITTTTVFECPNNIDTVIKHSGCNITLMDIGTPNFVAPAGMDMADVTIYNNAPADHIYEVGETTVTWVAKGMCGDSVTCDQIIKVSFQTCPDAVDFEGNSYPSVRLGSGCKCWTTENLVSTKYSDGRDIDEVMDYYSYEYPDVATNVSIFGHLYNWYSAADTARYGSVDSVERAYQSGNHIQGICPDGWYLPSDEEYDELNIYPTTDLRSTEYWIRVNGVANTNATGFNSLPGGMYNCSTGRFESMMGNSYYWTCHPVYDLATGAMIDYICEKIVTNNNSRCNGYSIRCIWGE